MPNIDRVIYSCHLKRTWSRKLNKKMSKEASDIQEKCVQEVIRIYEKRIKWHKENTNFKFCAINQIFSVSERQNSKMNGSYYVAS